MKHAMHAVWYLTMALMLGACATADLPTVDTFNKKLAVAFGTVTQVRQSATTLLKAKQLSAEDGQNVLEQTDVARKGLDVARTLSKTDLNSADGKLSAVKATLTVLEGYLATKGAK